MQWERSWMLLRKPPGVFVTATLWAKFWSSAGRENQVVRSCAPCYGEWFNRGLIDRMYLEEHWWFPSVTVPRLRCCLLDLHKISWCCVQYSSKEITDLKSYWSILILVLWQILVQGSTTRWCVSGICGTMGLALTWLRHPGSVQVCSGRQQEATDRTLDKAWPKRHFLECSISMQFTLQNMHALTNNKNHPMNLYLSLGCV